ncbi:MAG: T9SS type A sorting domain-containing protein [Bacteroidetes bacterium]|nr:T9SS type A sorting domain-containing protein [Bacteroidota bacterium]
MKRILLSIFAIASIGASAQDMIKATGFNEDFTTTGPTTDGTYSIYWWGKEAVGQSADCDLMAGAEKTKCEAFGTTRTRSGNGTLQLSVTQGVDGWSPIGFSLGNGDNSQFINISSGQAAGKVEVSLKNEGASDIEVYFTFTSNNDKAKIASGLADATKFGGVVAAGATYTTSYDLSAAKRVVWLGAVNSANCTGTMVGDNCVTDAGFSTSALSGVEFSINGAGASINNVWQQPAITNLPVAVYYIRGGATAVGISDVTSTSNLNIFPSPANDVVNVNFEAKENVTVSITDITGRVMLTQNVNAGTQALKFNVSTFSEGMYFVNIAGASGSHTEKLMVK